MILSIKISRSASKLQNTVSNAIEKPFLFKLIKYNFDCLSEYNFIHRSTKSFIHGKAAAGNKTNKFSFWSRFFELINP